MIARLQPLLIAIEGLAVGIGPDRKFLKAKVNEIVGQEIVDGDMGERLRGGVGGVELLADILERLVVEQRVVGRIGWNIRHVAAAFALKEIALRHA